MDVTRQLFDLTSHVELSWAEGNRPLHDVLRVEHEQNQRLDIELLIELERVWFPVTVGRNSKYEVAKPRTDEQILKPKRTGWYLRTTMVGAVAKSSTHKPGTRWENFLAIEACEPPLAHQILAAYREEEARLRDLMATHG